MISRSFVLTAAHCVDANAADSETPAPVAIGDIEVFHGSDAFRGGTLPLDQSWPVAIHPGWKRSGVRYAWDAALLKLAHPAASAVAAPVRAPPFATGWAVTSGWGYHDETNQSSDVLRAVRLPVIDQTACRARLAAIDAQSGFQTASWLHSATLCTLSPSDAACKNDSGGPLVIGDSTRPQTIGIVSWGLSSHCGVPGPTGELIGLYTRASELATWIVERTGGSSAVISEPPDRTFDVRSVTVR